MENQSYSFIEKYLKVTTEKTISRSIFWRRLIMIFWWGYLLPVILFTIAQQIVLNSNDAPLTSIIAFPIVLAGMFMSYSWINIFIINLINSSDIVIQLTTIFWLIIVLSMAFMHFTLAKKRINDFWGSKIELFTLYFLMIIGFLYPWINFIYFIIIWSKKTKIPESLKPVISV